MQGFPWQMLWFIGDAVKQIFIINKYHRYRKKSRLFKNYLGAAASSNPAVMEIALWNKALLKEGPSFVVLPGDEIRIGQFYKTITAAIYPAVKVRPVAYWRGKEGERPLSLFFSYDGNIHR